MYALGRDRLRRTGRGYRHLQWPLGAKAEPRRLVDVLGVDVYVGDQFLRRRPTERHGPDGVLARQEDVHLAVVVEVRHGGILEGRLRQQVETLRRKVREVELLHRPVGAFEAAKQVYLVVVREFCQLAEQRPAAVNGQQVTRRFEVLRSLQEEERRGLVVQSRLGALEEVELAVAVDVQPERHASPVLWVCHTFLPGHVDERRAGVVKELLGFGTHAHLCAGELHEVGPAVVVEVGPRGAVLVTLQVLGLEVLRRHVCELAAAQVAEQTRIVQVVRRRRGPADRRRRSRPTPHRGSCRHTTRHSRSRSRRGRASAPRASGCSRPGPGPAQPRRALRPGDESGASPQPPDGEAARLHGAKLGSCLHSSWSHSIRSPAVSG